MACTSLTACALLSAAAEAERLGASLSSLLRSVEFGGTFFSFSVKTFLRHE